MSLCIDVLNSLKPTMENSPTPPLPFSTHDYSWRDLARTTILAIRVAWLPRWLNVVSVSLRMKR